MREFGIRTLASLSEIDDMTFEEGGDGFLPECRFSWSSFLF